MVILLLLILKNKGNRIPLSAYMVQIKMTLNSLKLLIASVIENFENDSYVICGDLTLVINPDLDCENYININKWIKLFQHNIFFIYKSSRLSLL